MKKVKSDIEIARKAKMYQLIKFLKNLKFQTSLLHLVLWVDMWLK